MCRCLLNSPINGPSGGIYIHNNMMIYMGKKNKFHIDFKSHFVLHNRYVDYSWVYILLLIGNIRTFFIKLLSDFSLHSPLL